MTLTAAALADFQFAIKFAANRYRHYAGMDDPADNAYLYRSLADEREGDANALVRATVSSGLAGGNTTIDDLNAGPMLGMGDGDPYSSVSVSYRVQRAENTLARMAAQLCSLSSGGQLLNALNQVRHHISKRRDEVRDARRRSQSLESIEYGDVQEIVNTQVKGKQVAVWFGTNRVHTGRHFLGERATNVTYGRCHVFVPENRVAGSLGRGLIGRIFKGDNRVKLNSSDILGESQFWSSLANEVTKLDLSDQHGLIFLHGFNTKFEDAARRTAQLKVDLAHNGPTAFFSWPSLGNKAGYAGDEAAIDGSEAAIRDFLVDFAQRSGAKAVHIIAHSMGNRGLLRAMDAIANAAASAAAVRFGQVFLAAPDVDAQLFQNLAIAYGRLSTRSTLYVSNNDKAIGISKRLHKFARAGLTPPIAVVPGIDTIDASHVNLGLLGHSYAAEMRPVLSDIFSLIQGDRAPDNRFGLRKALGGTASHWEFIR